MSTLRRASQNIVLIVMTAGLAAAFGLSFGPAGFKNCNRESLKVTYIAKVYDTTLSEQDFQAQARALRLGEDRSTSATLLRQAIIDGMTERELLAHEAERLGMRVTDEEIDREIQDGYYYRDIGLQQQPVLMMRGLGGLRGRMESYSPRSPNHPEVVPPFNYEDFENWVRITYGRTVREYKKSLARELLAEHMRQLVMGNLRVPEDDVWRSYQRIHNLVSFRYLAFSPDFYRLTVREDGEGEQAFNTWLAAHQAEIDQTYTQRRGSLTGLPQQVRYRRSRRPRLPTRNWQSRRCADSRTARAVS